MRFSTHFLFFVLPLGTQIHQLPFTSLNVLAISSSTKFFRRICVRPNMTIIKPFRMPRARSKLNFAHFSASAIKVRPASIIRIVSTSRSNFDLGTMTSANSCSILASHAKSIFGLNSCDARRSL
jgi:hypothetical protein